MGFSIGQVAVADGGVLAPLAAITNAPFRQICLNQGCALAVTEMVASEAIVRSIGKVMLRMDRAHDERTLVVQLFGGHPDTMARAAELAVEKSGASIIDINMGCPVKKIVGGGAGVSLMREASRAAAIVEAIVKAVGATVPIMVKMRAGWDDNQVNAPEIAKCVEQAGALAVTVHARTKEQVHCGLSRWKVIAEVKRTVSIPVIGNGGIRSSQEAIGMMQETGCDAVMVGRGALGNPWIFESIRSGKEVKPSDAERFAVIREHIRLDVERSGESKAAREMRKHLGWYLRGLPGSAMVRAKLQLMTTASDLLHAIDSFEQAIANERVKASDDDFGGAPAWED